MRVAPWVDTTIIEMSLMHTEMFCTKEGIRGGEELVIAGRT